MWVCVDLNWVVTISAFETAESIFIKSYIEKKSPQLLFVTRGAKWVNLDLPLERSLPTKNETMALLHVATLIVKRELSI